MEIFVRPGHTGKWEVFVVGNRTASFTFDKQSEAREKAIEVAKKDGGKVTTCGKDGEVVRVDNY